MFLQSKVRPVRRADNPAAICELIVQQCGIINISQPYRPPRPVMGIVLFLHIKKQVLVYFIALAQPCLEEMNTNMDNSGHNSDIPGIKMKLQLLYTTVLNLPCSAATP
jgi:hypothetical protein